MKNGFTLTELVVVIALTAIIGIVLTDVFIFHQRAVTWSSAENDIQRDQTILLKQLKNSINEANQVVANRTINGISYASSQNTLVLELPAFDLNGNALVNIKDYAAIFRGVSNNKEIWLDIETASGSRRFNGKKLLGQTANELTFRYNHPDPTLATAVEVYFKGSQQKGEISQAVQGTTTIYLQNK